MAQEKRYRLPWLTNGESPSTSDFRLVGQPSWKNTTNRSVAIDDFFKTGQIRGSNAFNNVAYFQNQSPADAYLKTGTTSLTNEVPRRNFLIETSQEFTNNISENPLYNKYKTEGLGSEFYRTLEPNKNPNFINTINPENRKGLKITQFDVSDVYHVTGQQENPYISYMETNIPTNEKVIYDRITPFSKRPLSTHIANVSAEAKIIGNAKIPYTPFGVAGAGMAIGAAYTPFQLYEQRQAASGKYGNNTWDKEYGKSDPLALRAVYDAALGNQSPAGNFEKTITSPEYAQRNPIGATVYGTATGNMEYPKAFINAYLPNSMQLSNSERYERVGIYKGQ